MDRGSRRIPRPSAANWQHALAPLTPEQAREYLSLSKKQFERVSPHPPRRYLSERVFYYPRSRIDAALEAATSPDLSVVNSRPTPPGGGGQGGERSLRRALERTGLHT